jgi:hypothetical protein
MAAVNNIMLEGFAIQEGNISGPSKAPLTDLRYQKLGDETVCDLLLSWGAARSADQDQIAVSERAKGIRRRCPDCEDGRCGGGSGCVSVANTLTPEWDELFRTWTMHQPLVRSKLERFLAFNSCSSLPSKSELGKRLTTEGGEPSYDYPNCSTWDVFFEQLSSLWGRMGDQSERRMWLARFYFQRRQAVKEDDPRLAKLESAWLGFALWSKVQLAPTLISCEPLCSWCLGSDRLSCSTKWRKVRFCLQQVIPNRWTTPLVTTGQSTLKCRRPKLRRPN